MQFQVIVADCPFRFSDSLKQSDTKRSAQSNYDTMTMSELKSLNVKGLADPKGAVLAFWVPSSLLEGGIEVVNAWGFSVRQTYIWVKTKKDPTDPDPNKNLGFGMGRLTRACHEICLICINNNGIYSKLKNKSQRSVSLAYNKGHSIKPPNLQDSLDLMFPNCLKIELFARRERQGWITLGNQVGQCKDIITSINDTILI